MSHGLLTPQEQQIMDLHDQGLSNAEIAQQLNLTRLYVKTISSRYSDGDGGFEAMIVKGTIALSRAINRCHPEKRTEMPT